MTILWVLIFIFFTGDVQIVVQIVLDKGGNVSAYKSPSQETIKVILSQFSVVVIFWQNRMITLTYTIKIFFKSVAKCVVCQRWRYFHYFHHCVGDQPCSDIHHFHHGVGGRLSSSFYHFHLDGWKAVEMVEMCTSLPSPPSVKCLVYITPYCFHYRGLGGSIAAPYLNLGVSRNMLL